MVKRSETILFAIACIFAGLLWLAIIIPSSGGMIPFILFFWLIHLTVRSSIICHFKGNGVHINQKQFTSIHQAIAECTKQLGMKKQPQAYINNGNGVLNAFATHFLRTKYIILNSNVIDALSTKPEALKFYIGHELGHIRRRHSIKRLFIIPATWIPIFGAAYARACEYTCDCHGLYCCTSIEEAQIALATLTAGQNNWQDINIDVLLEQTKLTGKFWMTFNELTQSHPWLCKRIAAIRTLSSNEQIKLPRRNLFAMLFAGLIPNLSLCDKERRSRGRVVRDSWRFTQSEASAVNLYASVESSERLYVMREGHEVQATGTFAAHNGCRVMHVYFGVMDGRNIYRA